MPWIRAGGQPSATARSARVLVALALAMVLPLPGTGLPDVDGGPPRQMVGGDRLRARRHHRCPPAAPATPSVGSASAAPQSRSPTPAPGVSRAGRVGAAAPWAG